MARTFSELITELLRKDAGRPLITFYDDATGERVELSVTTWANWVAKTSNLFTDQFDLERGDRLHIDLPTHWLTPVFLSAAWNLGLVVTTDPAQAELVVCGPETVAAHHEAGRSVLACSLRPMGVRFAEPLPAGVADFGVEVWGQPDAFFPLDPPAPEDPAWDAITHQELVAPAASEVERLGGGGRLLTTVNPASPSGFTHFTVPLVSGGSAVWVRNPDPKLWAAHAATERATATAGEPTAD